MKKNINPNELFYVGLFCGLAFKKTITIDCNKRIKTSTISTANKVAKTDG